MSVLDSFLEDDAIGDDAARLLYATMRTVATSFNFPPPEGFSAWNDDAVATSVHDFLTSPRATERLVQIALLATDDASFERLLAKSLRNFLRDVARRTVVGALIRRLKDVLADNSEFSMTNDQISASDGPQALYGGDEAVLVRAAFKVDAGQRRWRPETRRRGPLATRDDLLAMIRAIVAAAGGAVSMSTVARVIARRYDLDPLPATTEVDVLDPRVGSEYESVDVNDQVSSLIEQLTEVERAVLPLLDMSCREAARLLPYGHSTIAKAQASLKTLLQQILPAGDTGAAVLRAAINRLTDETP